MLTAKEKAAQNKKSTTKPGDGEPSSVKRPGEQAPETSASKAAGPSMSPEERRRLVESAAYFRAEKRGFAPGFELEDWIEAEAEVLRLIGSA